MITVINLNELTETQKLDLKAEANALHNFYKELVKLYPDANLDKIGSNVELRLNVKITTTDLYPNKVIKYNTVKVVNNGIDYSKEFVS